MDLTHLGKILIFFGIILAAIGLIIVAAGKLPFLGRLPGDICVKKGNFTFYFPLATCILLSVFISLLLLFWRRFK